MKYPISHLATFILGAIFSAVVFVLSLPSYSEFYLAIYRPDKKPILMKMTDEQKHWFAPVGSNAVIITGIEFVHMTNVTVKRN